MTTDGRRGWGRGGSGGLGGRGVGFGNLGHQLDGRGSAGRHGCCGSVRCGNEGDDSTATGPRTRREWTYTDHLHGYKTDVKCYTPTCYECQLRQTTKVRIPPTVDMPAPLFRKIYADTMLMPPAGGFRCIVQGRCSLTAWPEWRMLRERQRARSGRFCSKKSIADEAGARRSLQTTAPLSSPP